MIAVKKSPGKRSAGLLLHRKRGGIVEVFLVHPGGPFWQRKDEGAWSIPKGEFGAEESGQEEDSLAAARREFHEETGFAVDGEFRALDPVRQAGGKTVYAWAIEADVDATAIVSNTFSMEWPPRSGKMRDFPEVDRAAWFDLHTARLKILKSQLPLLNQLATWSCRP
jgi:predicted NUDIX family NTP pyrophosphohydrolase